MRLNLGVVILFRQLGYSHDTVFFVFRLHNDSEGGGWRSGTTLQAGVWFSGGLNFTKDISIFSLHFYRCIRTVAIGSCDLQG